MSDDDGPSLLALILVALALVLTIAVIAGH